MPTTTTHSATQSAANQDATAPPSSTHAHHLPFGAELIDAQRTHFKLWAPDCDRVAVEIDEQAPMPMEAVGDGWFELIADCGAGARYRYRVADDLAVPDPAARAQAGDVHDASVVIDPRAYRWQVDEWQGRPWRETVLYEMHIGVLGGFTNAALQLPHLAALGITAVELMPIGEFPGQRNWGYDGVLPFAPDSAYGTPDELKNFIDTAHDLKLMVFLDVVYNHFGPDGNYLPSYAQSFFRDDVKTPWGPAIDFRQRPVAEFFIHNALYWLFEYRFDGLRFDAAHAVATPEFFDALAARVRNAVEPGRHVHLVLEHDGNIASHLGPSLFNAQWNDDFHHALHCLLTDEADGYYADYAERPAALLARCLAEGFAYQGDYSAHRDAPRGTPSAHLPPSAFVNFLQNHDQIGNRAHGERMTVLAPKAAVQAATALMLLSPQIPLLFMGEEWGSDQPFLYFTDHQEPLAQAVRDGRRREFSRFPAFRDEQALRAIADPNALGTFAASVPDAMQASSADHQTWGAFYRRLLALRQAEVVPYIEAMRSTGAKVLGNKAVLAGWRNSDDGRRLTIVCNLAAQPIDARVEVDGEVIYESGEGVVQRLRAGELAAYSVAVWVGR